MERPRCNESQKRHGRMIAGKKEGGDSIFASDGGRG